MGCLKHCLGLAVGLPEVSLGHDASGCGQHPLSKRCTPYTTSSGSQCARSPLSWQHEQPWFIDVALLSWDVLNPGWDAAANPVLWLSPCVTVVSCRASR